MSPGQTGHTTGQMGRVPGTDGDAHQGVSRQNSLCLLGFFLSPENQTKTLANSDKFRQLQTSQKPYENRGGGFNKHRKSSLKLRPKFRQI